MTKKGLAVLYAVSTMHNASEMLLNAAERASREDMPDLRNYLFGVAWGLRDAYAVMGKKPKKEVRETETTGKR